MALRQSIQVLAQKAIPAPLSAVDYTPIFAEFVVPAGLALNDVIEMGGIPANCIPVDLIVAFEDVDSNGSATVAFDAGIISGSFGAKDNARACGNEFFAADTTARAGGIARLNKAAGGLVAASQSERGWGLKVQAAAATLTVGAKIRATLLVVPA